MSTVDYTSPCLLDQPYTDFYDIPDLAEMAQEISQECGLLEDPDELDAMLSIEDFATKVDLVPEVEWPERIRDIDSSPQGWTERRIRKIKAQGKEGTCVYNALAGGMEATWNWMFGDHWWVELSPVSGYRWNASGPRSGSNVGQSLIWALETGLIPADTDLNRQFIRDSYFSHVHPARGYYEKFATGWKATATMFRVQEFLKLRTVEEWFSALFQGFVCIGGRDRHCIAHYRPLLQAGHPSSLYANSWGPWGLTMTISGAVQAQGFGVDSYRKVDVMVNRGAYAIRSLRIPTWMSLHSVI